MSIRLPCSYTPFARSPVSRFGHICACMLAILLGAPAGMCGGDPDVKDARREYSRHYFEIDARLAWARHRANRGDRYLAFGEMESVRREFGDEMFNRHHRKLFLRSHVIDDSEAAEKELLGKSEQDSESADTAGELADLYSVRGELQRAAEYGEKACQLAPESRTHMARLNDIYSWQYRQDDARRVQEEFAKRNPSSPTAYILRHNELANSDKRAARELLDRALVEHPKSGELLWCRASWFHESGELDKAEETLLRAAEVAPDMALVQGSLGRFFLKVRKNEARALEYYLKAYVTAPHYYDGEYAESRIRELSKSVSQRMYSSLRKGVSSPDALLQNKDPRIVVMAVQEMTGDWKPVYVDAAVALLDHNSPHVRWVATEALAQHVNANFEQRLRKLLRDPNDYRRGCATYIAASLWPMDRLSELELLLDDESQLVQYDVISALMIHARSAGKKLILRHFKDNRPPHLEHMLKGVEARNP